MATVTTIGAIYQESGCAAHHCRLFMGLDYLDDMRVRHIPENATNDGTAQSFPAFSAFDAIEPEIADQITAWLREQHAEVG